MSGHCLVVLIGLVCLSGCSASTAFYLQGNRAMAAGDYDRAAQAFSSALSENPQHVGALIALGIANYRRGAFDAAVDNLEHAQSLVPYDPSVRLYLALAALRLGRLDRTREQLQGFLVQVPSLRVREQTARAIGLLEEANLSDHVREYLAYSLEQGVEREQAVESLAQRVRTLEVEALYRPPPQVVQSTRCRC